MVGFLVHLRRGLRADRIGVPVVSRRPRNFIHRRRHRHHHQLHEGSDLLPAMPVRACRPAGQKIKTKNMTDDFKLSKKSQKILDYLAADERFYEGGTIKMFLEQGQRKQMGLTVPVYSLGTQKKDKALPFGYTNYPLADSVDDLLGRIIIW
jgi:hypothetical protein